MATRGLGIERRIGLSAGVDVTQQERHELDGVAGRGALVGERLYLRAGPPVVEKGLMGTLEQVPAQRRGVGWAAALAFGLVLAIVGALYRRAARAAELERVDAILEED